MSSVIWVFGETTGDEVCQSTFELIAAARALVDHVEVVVLGEPSTAVLAALGDHGVERTMFVPQLAGSLVGPGVARAIAEQITEANSPEAILFGATYDGRDVAARLSARIDRPVLTNIVGLGRVGDSLVGSHAVFGGNQVVTSRFTGPGPGIFVIRSKSFVAIPIGGSPSLAIVLEASPTEAADGATVLRRHVEEQRGPSLDAARIVVSGGRGLGDAKRFTLIESLAASLGGAPGASRAVVDSGWVPYSYQVGQTGKTVAPEVYLAFGISGATQHLVGMKGSKAIVAVNTDPSAPILKIADLGVVGDAVEILPRLLAALEARSSSS